MKKILIILILILNSICFGSIFDPPTKEEKNYLTQVYTTLFNTIVTYNERSFIEKAEEALTNPIHPSVFYDKGLTYGITARRKIAEFATFYTMGTIYKMDKNQIKKNKITIDEMEKDLKWKVDENAILYWYVPKGFLLGAIDLREPDNILIFGIKDAGIPSYIDEHLYHTYLLYERITEIIDLISYREPETYDFILRINGYRK